MNFDPSESRTSAGVTSADPGGLRSGRRAAEDGRRLTWPFDFDDEPPMGAGRDASEGPLPTADRFAEALARLAEDR